MTGPSKIKGIFQLDVKVRVELLIPQNVTIFFTTSVVQSTPENKAEIFVVKGLRLFGMSIQSDVSLFMFICASQKQRNGKVRYTYMKLRLYPC